MRHISTYGPTEWSAELLEEVTQEKEENDHPVVDQNKVNEWLENLTHSREADIQVIRKIL